MRGRGGIGRWREGGDKGCEGGMTNLAMEMLKIVEGGSR